MGQLQVGSGADSGANVTWFWELQCQPLRRSREVSVAKGVPTLAFEKEENKNTKKIIINCDSNCKLALVQTAAPVSPFFWELQCQPLRRSREVSKAKGVPTLAFEKEENKNNKKIITNCDSNCKLALVQTAAPMSPFSSGNFNANP